MGSIAHTPELVFPLLAGEALAVALIVAGWRIFSKAGQPGWACLVPGYNVWVVTRIVGRPRWWAALFILPGVNLVVWLVLGVDLAGSFGKGRAFGLGLGCLLLLPVLGFGTAQYFGPAVAPPDGIQKSC